MTKTPNLTLQRRLAASILKCGKRKVFLDPLSTKIADANSRAGVKKLIKLMAIRKRPDTVHSRYSVRLRNIAKSKGRHTGPGKRRGTKNARMPTKVAWVRRARVLRRLLKKYREKKKIDKHVYRSLYLQAKGNKFRTKRNLIETIHRIKTEEKRAAVLKSQAEARKAKLKVASSGAGAAAAATGSGAATSTSTSSTRKGGN
jgi:large subunit ribosomal protein L19e